MSESVSMADVIRPLWPTVRPFKGKFLIGVFIILFSTGVETLIPWVTGKSVDIAMSTAPDRRLFLLFILSFFVLIALKGILHFFQAYIIQSTGERVTHELRIRLFHKIQSLSIEYFDKNPTGRLLTRVINDIKSLSELFTASISVLALDFMIILGTVIAMFMLQSRLALLVLFTFPLVALTIHFFGKRLAEVYRVARARLSEINAFLGENIGAIATIQRLSAEEERFSTFSRVVDRHKQAQLDTVKVFASVQPVTNLLNGASVGTLIAVGGLWVIEGQMTLGVLVAFLGYLRNIFQPIRDLVEKYNTFLSAKVAAERVVLILGEASEYETANGVASEGLTPGALSFDRVFFKYPTRRELAMDNVSFSVLPGGSGAIVGPTGGGKSTIIRLLLRFYEAQSGLISFEGIPIKDWNKSALRSRMGVVQQETFLFQGSLRDNLRLGKDSISDDFLKLQCVKAQLWPLVEGRGGLDLDILEGGNNLSIGEKQLVSIARILVMNPQILIMDEATSSIDRILESRPLEAVNEVITGRTSIIIAHRLSTIQKCKKILVINKGRLEEQGTYKELVGAGGLFAKFHAIHESHSA